MLRAMTECSCLPVCFTGSGSDEGKLRHPSSFSSKHFCYIFFFSVQLRYKATLSSTVLFKNLEYNLISHTVCM